MTFCPAGRPATGQITEANNRLFQLDSCTAQTIGLGRCSNCFSVMWSSLWKSFENLAFMAHLSIKGWHQRVWEQWGLSGLIGALRQGLGGGGGDFFEWSSSPTQQCGLWGGLSNGTVLSMNRMPALVHVMAQLSNGPSSHNSRQFTGTNIYYWASMNWMHFLKTKMMHWILGDFSLWRV